MSREPFEATTLDDLSDVVVVVTIPRPDKKNVNVRLRALSSEEVWRIRSEIVWPKPPVTNFKKIGGEVLPQYDYEDKTYRDTLENAQRNLGFRILLASLQLAIPGLTDEERLNNLRQRLGQWAYNHLLAASNRIHIPQIEEVEAVALSFRPAGNVGASGDDGTRPDTEPVEQTGPTRAGGIDSI